MISNIEDLQREQMMRVIDELKQKQKNKNESTLFTDLFNSLLYWLGLY
jgi:hypothetical protein